MDIDRDDVFGSVPQVNLFQVGAFNLYASRHKTFDVQATTLCSSTFLIPSANACSSSEKMEIDESSRYPMTDSLEHLIACQAQMAPDWVNPRLKVSEMYQFAHDIYEGHIKFKDKPRDFPKRSLLPFNPTQCETEKFAIEFYLAVFEGNLFENTLLMSIDSMYQWYSFYIQQSWYGYSYSKKIINLQTWREIVQNVDCMMRIYGSLMYHQHIHSGTYQIDFSKLKKVEGNIH